MQIKEKIKELKSSNTVHATFPIFLLCMLVTAAYHIWPEVIGQSIGTLAEGGAGATLGALIYRVTFRKKENNGG